MSTYKISGHVTISCWTEVEAESEAEARIVAAAQPLAEILIDGGYPIDECWHMEADGEPTITDIEVSP